MVEQFTATMEEKNRIIAEKIELCLFSGASTNAGLLCVMTAARHFV